MKCAIMQPMFLPWSGYFSLIDQVDVFVFLDDSQYEKSSWQNRNKLLIGGKEQWVTVPTRRAFLGQSIKEVPVESEKPWRRKQQALLRQTYGKHDYWNHVEGCLDIIGDETLVTIGSLNIALIQHISNSLGLDAKIFCTSELGISGTRTQRLIDICEYFGSTEYVSPIGSRDYLTLDGFTNMTKIKLSYNSFEPKPYQQKGVSDFVGYLSVFDVLANLGSEETRKYLEM